MAIVKCKNPDCGTSYSTEKFDKCPNCGLGIEEEFVPVEAAPAVTPESRSAAGSGINLWTILGIISAVLSFILVILAGMGVAKNFGNLLGVLSGMVSFTIICVILHYLKEILKAVSKK